MKNKLIIPNQVVTANSSNDILRNHAVEIAEGKIERIVPLNDFDKSKL